MRWAYGVPPAGNANFAWVQHFVHHLAPNGVAGFVLANGSLSSKQSGEGEIRRKLVEADLVDCIVALPEKLFFNTGIPVCLWFLAKNRHGNGHRPRRRRGAVHRRPPTRPHGDPHSARARRRRRGEGRWDVSLVAQP